MILAIIIIKEDIINLNSGFSGTKLTVLNIEVSVLQKC